MADEDLVLDPPTEDPPVAPVDNAENKANLSDNISKVLEMYKGMIKIKDGGFFAKFSDPLEVDKEKAKIYEKPFDQEFIDAAAQAAKVHLKNAQIFLDQLKAMEGM